MSRRRREARRPAPPTWDDVGALAKAVREVELTSAPLPDGHQALAEVEPPAEWFPTPDFRREVLSTMTVVQLRQYAKDHGVDLKGARLKAELITVLSA